MCTNVTVQNRMAVTDPEVNYYLVHLSQYFICLMNAPKEFGVVLTEETVEVNAKNFCKISLY